MFASPGTSLVKKKENIMSAELVVRKVREAGTGADISSIYTVVKPVMNKIYITHKDVEALLMYRTEVGKESASLPWHKYGKASTTMTLDEIKEYLDVAAPITHQDATFIGRDDEIHVMNDRRAVEWYVDLDGDGVSESHYLGSVGNNTEIVQNEGFFESFRSWESAGFTMETAGYLAGGRKVFGSVNLKTNEEEFTVRKGDVVAPYFFFAHAHDGTLSLTGGLTMVRVVCNNTLSSAIGGKNLVKKKHTGDVLFKTEEIHKIAQGIIAQARGQIEQYRKLDSKLLSSSKEVERFVNIIQGEPKDQKNESRVMEAVLEKFSKGIGINPLGTATYWDLLNSWTELSNHSLGNEKKGESTGDRAVRRLEAQWFGTEGKSNVAAMNAALVLSAAA